MLNTSDNKVVCPDCGNLCWEVADVCHKCGYKTCGGCIRFHEDKCHKFPCVGCGELIYENEVESQTHGDPLCFECTERNPKPGPLDDFRVVSDWLEAISFSHPDAFQAWTRLQKRIKETL